MNLKKYCTSKFVGTGPSSYKKKIYRASVSQRLRNTDIQDIGDVGQCFSTAGPREVLLEFVILVF